VEADLTDLVMSETDAVENVITLQLLARITSLLLGFAPVAVEAFQLGTVDTTDACVATY
jgi:hypothetical protein